MLKRSTLVRLYTTAALALIAAEPTLAQSTSALVSIVSLDPPAQARLTKDTVIKAELRVTISNFYEPGIRYFVMPVFVNRAGGTFNALDTVQEATPIMTANGSVKINYPVAKELASPKLDRPPKLSFVLVKVSGGDEPKVVADTPDVRYVE